MTIHTQDFKIYQLSNKIIKINFKINNLIIIKTIKTKMIKIII